MAVDEDWRYWSLISNGLRWRIALPSDVPALQRLLDDAHLIMGAQERPDLLAFPVILTLVAETPEGRIVDGLYLECEAYVRKLGLSRAGMLSSEALAPVLASFLVSRKIRLVRVAVPLRLARIMRGTLARMGMIEVTQSFTHWVRKLRP